MRIIGIDPGVRTIGIGWLDAQSAHRISVNDWCSIETGSGVPLATRLHEIAVDFKGLLDEIQPDLAVVERLFFAVNVKSALEVAQARGVLLECLAARAIPILEPTPLELKAAITGDGQADKRQVQDMMMRSLNLTERPTPVDAADALALAYFGALQSHTLSVA